MLVSWQEARLAALGAYPLSWSGVCSWIVPFRAYWGGVQSRFIRNLDSAILSGECTENPLIQENSQIWTFLAFYRVTDGPLDELTVLDIDTSIIELCRKPGESRTYRYWTLLGLTNKNLACISSVWRSLLDCWSRHCSAWLHSRLSGVCALRFGLHVLASALRRTERGCPALLRCYRTIATGGLT